MSDRPARIAAAMPASARFFWSVEASASTRAAALALRPMSLMVAAISPDPSTVFSGAVMVGLDMLKPVITRRCITSCGRSHLLAWHGRLSSTVGAGNHKESTDDPDRSQPRHRTQDGGAAEPSAGHRHAVRHPRRGARGGRLRLFIRHHGAGDGRPRRHPCRCAEAFQCRSERHADRPGAAGELLHRGGLPRPVAQAAEVRHLHRGPGEGRAGRRRHHQAEGHRAAAHGLLPPHPRHAGLHHRLSRADQGVGDLARQARASACSASRR